MALIGSILGDIAGSQYEFSRWRPADLDWKNCILFTDKCKFTDDTVMGIGTKMAILEDKNNPNFAKWYRNLGQVYPRAGYGGMFQQWIKDASMGPYGSFGNGSAMRIAYIGEAYDNVEDIVSIAKQSAKVTHNHPEGVKGAVVTAMCVFMARQGKTKQDIYNYVSHFYGDEDKYKYPITMSLEDMRKTYRWNEICQDSVPAAIRCVLEAESYEEFLRNVFSLPCDMDTLGAIGVGIE
jgi:ADP-ribosylglycohydrolase